MAKTTISDVAKAAGVSTMTVSRVLNGRGEISQETRERVQLVIRQLNYRPSALARNLKTQRTHTIGLIIPDISNPFFPELVRGAEDMAAQEGFAVILCNTVRNPDRERKALELLEDKRVDGLILCSSGLPDNELLPLLKQHGAVVLFDRVVDKSIAGLVKIDDVYGAISAASHLLDIGRRRLGLLAGPSYYLGSEQRRYGFRVALETRGVLINPKSEISCEPDESGGLEATKQLLKKQPKLDGLFCFNDLVALGALDAFSELGIRVPEDVAVVGFDDIRLAGLTTPTLSTLRVDKGRLGRAMVEMVLDRIEEHPAGQAEEVIRPELIIRQSAPLLSRYEKKTPSQPTSKTKRPRVPVTA
ncbi:MAG: LacI family DNA-binding transcriptional regulator, partial [Verrucomicrobia bacterium]|nr:LacI family DNA-binding transcriptional regulator [Verrucomicrobiota bacterium]